MAKMLDPSQIGQKVVIQLHETLWSSFNPIDKIAKSFSVLTIKRIIAENAWHSTEYFGLKIHRIAVTTNIGVDISKNEVSL
mmetsp:Transcript_8555/g.8506  ORF Transcript_8555/g.8506 Transcript_8555/m.8506 type:complete len:81 (-) Transcript_8555:284-526(-)